MDHSTNHAYTHWISYLYTRQNAKPTTTGSTCTTSTQPRRCDQPGHYSTTAQTASPREQPGHYTNTAEINPNQATTGLAVPLHGLARLIPRHQEQPSGTQTELQYRSSVYISYIDLGGDRQ